MKNKELKKPIPVELNEEELDMVAGGVVDDPGVTDSVTSIAVNDYFNERIPCISCGKLVWPTEVVYSNHIDAYCRDCYEARFPK